VTPPRLAQPAERPISPTPPLAVLAVAASFAAMWLNRVLLIVLDGHVPTASLLQLSRWGEFATNLAVVASLVTLLSAFVTPYRYATNIPLRRRIFVAGLTGVMVFTVARATFFPRERSVAAMIWVSIGAAYILAIYIAMEGARWAKSIASRTATIAAASMAFLALIALVIERLNFSLSGFWQTVVVRQLQRAGEAGYIVALMGSTAFAMPLGRGRRNRLALALTLLTFAITFIALSFASVHLRGDFALALQYALRVSWLVDQLPSLYILVLCAAWSAALGALVGTDRVLKSAALGIVLLICSGYAPRSPDRLVMLVLSILLIARAVIERTHNKVSKDTDSLQSPQVK
jgi:hypothetical protein